MVKSSNTAFRDVRFKGCKILGVRFEDCNKFLLEMNFEDCLMNISSFYQLAIKKTIFKSCSLQEADFTEADLSGSVFTGCNLKGAVFYHTTMEKVDFRTSNNYSIDPEINKLKKARFSIPGVLGLLRKYDILIE